MSCFVYRQYGNLHVLAFICFIWRSNVLWDGLEKAVKNEIVYVCSVRGAFILVQRQPFGVLPFPH